MVEYSKEQLRREIHFSNDVIDPLKCICFIRKRNCNSKKAADSLESVSLFSYWNIESRVVFLEILPMSRARETQLSPHFLVTSHYPYFSNRQLFVANKLYRSEGENLAVHFEIRFDPRYQTISTADVVEILTREIDPTTSKYLTNLTIDSQSLEVQESLTALNAQVAQQTTVSTPPPTTTPPPPRRCTSLDLSYCKHLPYNVTSYPNILGHRSLADVEEDVIAFRWISSRDLRAKFPK